MHLASWGSLALGGRLKARLRKAKSSWRAIADEVGADLTSCQHQLLQAVIGLESRLAAAPLAQRILERAQRYDREAVRIVAFSPELREHFYRLNDEWLQREFYLEEIDRQVLSEPEQAILAPGGYIAFAQVADEIVGTCALRLDRPGVYELTKMAVTTRFQGRGIGRLLLEVAIAEFQRRGGRQLFLESSSKLGPALRLYQSMGFDLQPGLRAGSHYQRADVYMIWRPPHAAHARARVRARKRTRVARGRRHGRSG
jgi:ribosomal protein S18 acetylase RimI-like enzyme